MFTKIGNVLDKASAFKGEFGPREKTNLILGIADAIDIEFNGITNAGIARIAELQTGFGIPTETPNEIVKRYAEANTFDTGYLALYDGINLRNSLHWDVYTQGVGITFNKMELGADVRFARTEGVKQTYSVDYYAAGLQILDMWIENNQWYQIEQASRDFMNAYMRKKAEVMYGLLDAVGASAAQDLAWDTNGSDTLEKDITTINTACQNIISDLESTNYAVNADGPFVMYAKPAMKGRLLSALRHSQMNADAVRASLTSRKNLILNTVIPVFTNHLSSAAKYYVCAPKRKAHMATRKELTSEKTRDVTKLADIEVKHAAWGGCIADVNQVQHCATA